MVITQLAIGFWENEIESRSLINRRIKEVRWSEDYRDGWKEMLAVSRHASALSWVPLVCLLAIVFSRPPR